MDKKVTINDIATEAGVSKTTISRYLNGKFENMSSETKLRIKHTIQKLDYHPNRQAQTLKSHNSLLIGVSVADISNTYTSRLLKGLGTFFQNTNYQVLIMDADNNTDTELHNLEKMLVEKVDGIILQPLLHEPTHYKLLSNNNIPVVQVDRYVEPLTWPAVVSDNFQKSMELAAVFKNKSYDSIIILANQINGISSRMNRFHGLEAGLKNSNINITLIEIDNIGWQNILKMKLHEYNRTAIFALNGQVLWTAIRLIKSLNLKIPKDIGLVGYDDEQFADMLTPEISSISQNPQEIGRTAAEQLLSSINNHDNPISKKIIRIPSQINLRDSL